MKKTYLFYLIALVLLITACSEQTKTSSPRTDQIDQLVSFTADNGMFNGAILVAENGEIIYENGFGLADKEKEMAINTETAFYLASVSKQFTTMGIMILKEEGKLNFEDKLSDYFPEFPDYAKEVTIRHLMTHTSGIPDHYSLGAYKAGLKNSDVFDILVKQDSLQFEPGSRYSYSNGGYVLLSMIIEKISGQPTHEFMQERVFGPLNMTRTLVYDESAPVIDNRAKGYNWDQLDDYEIFTTGAGGLFSTVGDLLKWDQALYTEKLISQETLNEAFTPFTLNNGEISNYGYGWQVAKQDGDKLVRHSGSLSGYRTYITRNLSDKTTIIILTNNGPNVAMGELNTGIAHILKGEDFELPNRYPSNQIMVYLDNMELSEALSMTETEIQENPEEFEQDETGMNRLGYFFINNDKLDKARVIFEKNIEWYPNSSNVYDSYGEVLLAQGDTTAAVENYKKSIALNPDNQGGIQALIMLGYDMDEFITDVSVDESILESYTGSYIIDENMTFVISREGSQLFITPTDQQKSELFPASEVRFYSKIVNAQITFHASEGPADSLTLHQGGDFVAKRVEQ